MIQIDFIVKSSPITQRGVNLSPVCGLGDKNIEKIGITKENIFPKTIILPYLSRFQSAFQIFYNCNYMITIQLGYFPMQKMLVICMSVSWVVLEWYLSHDFIVGNKNLSSCKSVYYVLYKCCFLLFSQVTYQYTFVIWLIVR